MQNPETILTARRKLSLSLSDGKLQSFQNTADKKAVSDAVFSLLGRDGVHLDDGTQLSFKVHVHGSSISVSMEEMENV